KYASKNHSGETENMATEEAILSYKANAEAEIEALKSSEQDKDALKNQIAQLERDIALKASALSAKRREAAGRLSSRISEILTELGMPNAAFSVSLEAKNAQNENPGTMLLGPWGADNVEFLIQANTGDSAKELARIASGGELSRVMLAIKTALINEDQNETLIFDEIDTGIGGEVALSVGDYLYKIGAIKQIFCITHLANIAALADNHLKVEKSSDGMRTTTQLVNLKGENRLKEIARLLSGGVGQTALAHAAELLEKYGGRNNEQN
ncbi:MAG: DNA repair protein RecN, partial [Spirochaetaceae bacterium]|nr:DNA repair protein RecN [Spirochaetaceae bacterium]